MTSVQKLLLDVAQRDSRYAHEAYLFLREALDYTQHRLGRAVPAQQECAGAEHHVSGPELVEGYLNLALQQFGRMGRIVLRSWGINSTDDIGEMVFNLIDAGLLGKSDTDQRSDFHALCDLDRTLVDSYQICLDD